MHTSKKTQAVSAINRFSVTEWRDNVETAAKDMVSASKRVLDLVLAARDNVHEDTVRDALQHAFGEAYADLQGVSLEMALTAKSVKNRISDAMAVFKAEVMPAVLPGNLQHAAAECRKLNKKAKPEAANDQDDETGSQSSLDDEPGLGLSQPVDATHVAIEAMLASLKVLRGQAKGAVLTSLLDDMAELVDDLLVELTASE